MRCLETKSLLGAYLNSLRNEAIQMKGMSETTEEEKGNCDVSSDMLPARLIDSWGCEKEESKLARFPAGMTTK